MLCPRIKVLHVPDFDCQTTVATFVEALEQVRDWSGSNSSHVPVLLLLELKSESADSGAKRAPWSRDLLNSVEREILAAL